MNEIKCPICGGSVDIEYVEVYNGGFDTDTKVRVYCYECYFEEID